MSKLDRVVVNWMRGHRGTVSTDALEADGVSVDQRKRLVGAGVLQRVVDGGYVFAGAPADELARCAALCTSRSNLVVAGPTAGRMWGIRRSPPDGLVHVIAPPASHPCREPWVRAYRTALLDAEDVVHRHDGIRLTSPARTTVDLSRYLTDESLRSAVESVLHTELASLEALYRTAQRLDTPGRPWAQRFLRLLTGRHPGKAAESDWECKVIDALVALGVTDLERQVEADLPGFGRVRFDAAIRSIKWAAEIDVHPSHALSSGVARDSRRDRSARAAGWVTERVVEDDLQFRFDATMAELVASVARRRHER